MKYNSQIEEEDEEFRSRISSVDEEGKRKWIHAIKPEGKFYNLRLYLAYFYLAIFFIMPLIRIDGAQFLQFNVLEGKFNLFGKIFWPTDFFIFAIAFITLIITVVLFTVVYGRIFCGWVCPQTIFMEFVFRQIEWWIEGTPAQQRKLNKAPWNAEKILKKGGKQIIFFLFSFLIANTFFAYIIGSDVLFQKMQQPISENFATLAGLIGFTFVFYFVFAYVREIVCTTICPYGRLQGVMFDKDTMQISYDYNRGEPRGKLKNKEEDGLGDCIDCKKCVVVCPTGIDIRDGVQMECVGCTACIDACDDIMEQINLPKGLIRYASENEIESGVKSPITLKVKAYTGLLVILFIFLGTLIATRKNIETFIGRVKGQTYQVDAQAGTVSNLFDAKIINKSKLDVPVELRLIDVEGTIKIVGHDEDNHLLLKKEAINKTTFFIELPKESLGKRTTEVKVGVYRNGKLFQKVETKFLAPFKF
ncbi:MAG TPA: cytochrome c oxidase accessory protein CcoG [Chitinophagales bacterium]|nr:cytochrome c oxidase accessory protein CcoG [Chitinophagales bacterium]